MSSTNGTANGAEKQEELVGWTWAGPDFGLICCSLTDVCSEARCPLFENEGQHEGLAELVHSTSTLTGKGSVGAALAVVVVEPAWRAIVMDDGGRCGQPCPSRSETSAPAWLRSARLERAPRGR